MPDRRLVENKDILDTSALLNCFLYDRQQINTLATANQFGRSDNDLRPQSKAAETQIN